MERQIEIGNWRKLFSVSLYCCCVWLEFTIIITIIIKPMLRNAILQNTIFDTNIDWQQNKNLNNLK